MFKIKGREVIKVAFTWTLAEMAEFMREHWDKENYNDFEVGRPTPASIEEYICLPATEHCLVIAYPRREKVIFSVADNPDGLKRMTMMALPTKNAFARIYQSSLSVSRAKEMTGPAAEICTLYADYMRELLKQNPPEGDSAFRS